MLDNARVTDAVAISLLAAFPRAFHDRLLSDAILLDVPAGGTIYRDDDDPRCVLIVDGLVRVYLSAPSGKEVTVRYARRGEMLGIPVIVGGPAPVSVQVLTDASLLYLNARTLRVLGQTDPTVCWLLATDICQRLYETLDALADNTFGSLRQRVARHLLDIASGQRQGTSLVAGVSQQGLADAVGSARPAVARVIAELRDRGLVATAPDGIAILDPARLYDEVWTRELSHS